MTDIYHFDKRKEKQVMIKTDAGKRKKDQFIENLREGDVVNDLFAVKLKKPMRSYKKGTFFEFIAKDKTGEISVKFWGGDNKERIKRLYDSFTIGDVIQIRSGNVEYYEEKPQISINETVGGVRRCSPNEYDPADFIPALEEKQITQLFEIVKNEINTITEPSLKKLLNLFFKDPEFIQNYKHSPSAISHHHNYVGGNLQHTVGVIKLCNTILDSYPTGINHDLLITGALLHDVGKLKEYKYEAAIEKTAIGNFIGHIVIGDRWIREKINELRQNGEEFPEELETHLLHLILSHHGRYEWGSPKIPKTVEACTLHYADLMDSQVKNYQQNLEEAKKMTEEDWAMVFDSELGKRRLVYLGDIEQKL